MPPVPPSTTPAPVPTSTGTTPATTTTGTPATTTTGSAGALPAQKKDEFVDSKVKDKEKKKSDPFLKSIIAQIRAMFAMIRAKFAAAVTMINPIFRLGLNEFANKLVTAAAGTLQGAMLSDDAKNAIEFGEASGLTASISGLVAETGGNMKSHEETKKGEIAMKKSLDDLSKMVG